MDLLARLNGETVPVSHQRVKVSENMNSMKLPFTGNVSRVREVLKEKAVDVSAPDKHGEDGFTV